MTTIACDGHWMAADGQVTDDGGTVTELDDIKIERLSDGSIFGLAGGAHARPALRDFFEGRAKEVEACGEWSALRLMPDGSGLFYCDKHPTRGIRACWPATLGSGGLIALGALLAGKTPKEAVEIAAQRDTGTGGQIVCLALDA